MYLLSDKVSLCKFYVTSHFKYFGFIILWSDRICLTLYTYPMLSKRIKKIAVKELSKNGEEFLIKNFVLEDLEKQQKFIKYGEANTIEGISFIACTKGEGAVRINLREYKVTKNSIITILPNHIVEVISGSKDLILNILIFSFDFISDLPLPKNHNLGGMLAKHPCIKVSDEDMADLAEYHKFIFKQYSKKDSTWFKEDMIKGLLYSFLSNIGNVYLSNKVVEVGTNNLTSSHQEELTERFFELLKQYYKTERTVAFYADKMCFSSKYLSTTIKKVTGKSILTWLNYAVIMEAKVLLKKTDLTATQISEELNFPNPSFFGRLFKKNTGLTPMDYRES